MRTARVPCPLISRGPWAARPAPGGPAKACAIVSHSAAAGPVACECGVVAMAPLGRDQAELDRIARDHLGRTLVEAPRRAVGRAELDGDVGRRHLESVCGVAVGARARAEPSDVVEGGRARVRRPERVVDVLGVRPGLHDPARHRRGDGEVRAVPRRRASRRPPPPSRPPWSRGPPATSCAARSRSAPGRARRRRRTACRRAGAPRRGRGRTPRVRAPRRSPPRRSTRGGSPGRTPSSPSRPSGSSRRVGPPRRSRSARRPSPRRGARRARRGPRRSSALPPRCALLGEGAGALLGVLARVHGLPERVGRLVGRGHRQVDGAAFRRPRDSGALSAIPPASSWTASCSPAIGTTRFTSPTS